MDYSLRKQSLEIALRRYHKGLLETALAGMTATDMLYLLDDLPIILGRVFWPGLALYSDFIDEGDYTPKTIYDLCIKYLSLPRNNDVAVLSHIFWFGVGHNDIPQNMIGPVSNNIRGLATNITSSAFNTKTLDTLATSFLERNPVRKVSGLESLVIGTLISHAKNGGLAFRMFQLVTCCVLIALYGINRKVVYSYDKKLPDVKTIKIPEEKLPLFLHLDAPKGKELRARLGERQHLAIAQTAIVKLWEEYELLKVSPDAICSEYPNFWGDYLLSTISPDLIKKWETVYYPKLQALASGSTKKAVASVQKSGTTPKARARIRYAKK